MPEPIIVENGGIHEFFGLSYAQYLAIPRTVLQSMPLEWQEKFVKCLEEMNETFPGWMQKGCSFYHIQLRDAETGKFVEDYLADYERGRRRLASFDEWYKEFQKILADKSHLGLLPKGMDKNSYRESYEEGMTPKERAEQELDDLSR